MFRVALESILGVEISRGDTLILRPCIPDEWPGFTLRYRLPGTRTVYELDVRQGRGETCATIDAGAKILVNDGALRIPLVNDGAVHLVRVTLGSGIVSRFDATVAQDQPPSASP
jgi:cyclic beta-1,2-glucan synthetase